MPDITTLVPYSKPLGWPLFGCPCKYIRNNDFLRISAWNSATGVTLEWSGLLLTTAGDYVPLQGTLVPTTDRLETSVALQLTEGFLYHLQFRVTAGTVRRGQCFVKAQLQQGDVDNAIKHTTLISDYVELGYEPVFPGSPIRSSTEGPGLLRLITGTDPAAGVENSNTVPTNARWKLLSYFVQLVASAAVANRFHQLRVSDGTTTHVLGQVDRAITAGQTMQISYITGGVGGGASGIAAGGGLGGDTYLAGGWTLASNTRNLDTGDNFGADALHVEEWIEE